MQNLLLLVDTEMTSINLSEPHCSIFAALFIWGKLLFLSVETFFLKAFYFCAVLHCFSCCITHVLYCFNVQGQPT